MKILIAEDDKILAESLKQGFGEEGEWVEVENSGHTARDRALSEKWDLFIFDLMLPGLSGFQLCEVLRFKQITTPILMLSALSETEDKVKALDMGADDYLTKTFHFREILSRIRALNRRNSQYTSTSFPVLNCADLRLDFEGNKVERNGRNIELSSKELYLLKTLLEDKNEVVNRPKILQKVWNTSQDTNTQ